MKTYLLFASFLFLVISGCRKENAAIPQSNERLKRILLYASLTDRNPVSIVEEYEYNPSGQLVKATSPKYDNGRIDGILRYSLYEYDSAGQLKKVTNFNANLNAPSGFINLSTSMYTYSVNGKKEKEYIEYPQINSFEYSLFTYNGGRLEKIEKYGNRNQLVTYQINDYNNESLWIKETFYDFNDRPYSYIVHSYNKGLLVKSLVYSGNSPVPVREINRKYDSANNLIALESKELSLFSSAMSHVLRYEYE